MRVQPTLLKPSKLKTYGENIVRNLLNAKTDTSSVLNIMHRFPYGISLIFLEHQFSTTIYTVSNPKPVWAVVLLHKSPGYTLLKIPPGGKA